MQQFLIQFRLTQSQWHWGRCCTILYVIAHSLIWKFPARHPQTLWGWPLHSQHHHAEVASCFFVQQGAQWGPLDHHGWFQLLYFVVMWIQMQLSWKSVLLYVAWTVNPRCTADPCSTLKETVGNQVVRHTCGQSTKITKIILDPIHRVLPFFSLLFSDDFFPHPLNSSSGPALLQQPPKALPESCSSRRRSTFSKQPVTWPSDGAVGGESSPCKIKWSTKPVGGCHLICWLAN